MESFRIDGQSVRSYAIRVDEVTQASSDLVRTLIDIDLQTFSEASFSSYTAVAMLDTGRVFVLRANQVIIGSCVCYRSWQNPDEATLLAMGIRPGWRGRGLGQRFVTGVLEKLQQSGMRTVKLFVGADNQRAIRTYNDVGFAAEPQSFVDPQSGDTLRVMRCALRPPPPKPRTGFRLLARRK